MSDKPASSSCSNFFQRFVSGDSHETGSDVNKETISELSEEQNGRREFCVSVRNFALGVLGLAMLPGGLAHAENETDRFDLLKRLDSTNSANFASGQKTYSFPKHLQPPLFTSEDVRNKDKDKLGLDIASPSNPFEQAKRLHSMVKSRYGLIKRRLQILTFIKRNSDNFKDADNLRGPLHSKHKEQLRVHDNEFRVNTALEKLWEPINNKMESLRKNIKTAVELERTACMVLKRCAKAQQDLGPGDLVDVVKVASQQKNNSFDSYDKANIPPGFNLEGFKCAKVGNPDKTTNSEILENAKFLEKLIENQTTVICKREEVFLQMEDMANGFSGGSNTSKKAELVSVYKSGRAHNEKLRKAWGDIIREVREIKKLIIDAERQQFNQAYSIRRCMVK